MTARVAINGFGRIGRLVMRANHLRSQPLQISAINNPGIETDQLVYLLKYDSAHGRINENTKVQKLSENEIQINDQKITVNKEKEPSKLKWGDQDIDIVLECTGKFLTKEKSQPHIDAGAKKVILSAPAKDDTPLFVYGVNHNDYQNSMKIISNASCTTNCLAPLAKVINDNFGIKSGLMTTIHAVTISQSTVDGQSSDYRKGRASLNNIIPSSTGAAKAVSKVIPELNGKLTGMAFRVPTVNVSCVDLTFTTDKQTSYDQIS